jgi:hypothetical protein
MTKRDVRFTPESRRRLSAWVISGHLAAQSPCLLYPQKRTSHGQGSGSHPQEIPRETTTPTDFEKELKPAVVVRRWRAE